MVGFAVAASQRFGVFPYIGSLSKGCRDATAIRSKMFIINSYYPRQ
jgi:hypothetical protein